MSFSKMLSFSQVDLTLVFIRVVFMHLVVLWGREAADRRFRVPSLSAHNTAAESGTVAIFRL